MGGLSLMSNNISKVALKPKSAVLSIGETTKCNHLISDVVQFKIDYDEAVMSGLPYRLNGIDCFVDGDIYANFTASNLPKRDEYGFISAVIYNGDQNIKVKIEMEKSTFSVIKSTATVYLDY